MVVTTTTIAPAKYTSSSNTTSNNTTTLPAPLQRPMFDMPPRKPLIPVSTTQSISLEDYTKTDSYRSSYALFICWGILLILIILGIISNILKFKSFSKICQFLGLISVVCILITSAISLHYNKTYMDEIDDKGIKNRDKYNYNKDWINAAWILPVMYFSCMAFVILLMVIMGSIM
jgi:hypothetical protein